MTTACVGMEELKSYLRIDHDADDALLETMAQMATEAIETRLRRPVIGTAENALAKTADDVPASIRLTAATIVAFIYENRTASDTEIRDRVLRSVALDQYIDWGAS